MNATAIIPVPAGPVGQQVMRTFLGQPGLVRPIAAAQAAGVFDRVIVVTDDPATAGVATGAGATVIGQPGAAATPQAVLRSVLAGLALPPERLVALIHPTALLLRADDLHQGVALARDSATESVLAVASYPAPVQRALRIDGGLVRMMRQENLFLRSQDLTEACHDAQQFQIMRAAAWATDEPLKIRPLPVPRHLVPVLETDADWRRAEMLAQVLAEVIG